MKTKMHFGASPRIFSNAKALRGRMTFAEKLLWSRIRNNQLGYHFRRQHPSSKYVTDFHCVALRLVIEVDGNVHDQESVKQDDKSKQDSLKSYGLIVIRFTNEQVIKSIDTVVESIKNTIQLIEEEADRS